MPKFVSFTVLAATLTLVGVTGASASGVRTKVQGDDSSVRTTSYGGASKMTLEIKGDRLDVEAVAGPCPWGRPSQTTLRGSNRHFLYIEPCTVD